ncbi:hypothetical protein QCA50_017945 [Cerrena zonata]|uniref:N-acetyltransferase domain-containing protein n=1 Tax=Cerrena zonata TaxID=2478898 RepID=A0AAW0FE61_9APHY
MVFINLYKPPVVSSPLAENELYGPEPHDVNFVYPLTPESLETERIRLTPFVPRVHMEATWEVLSTEGHELFRYFRFINQTPEVFLTWHERSIRQDPQHIIFVVIDKTFQDEARPEFGGSLAGLIALFGTSVEQLTTEIAFVVTFPAFQRSHVAANAVGVLMKYCLEVPSATVPGLGLRRVKWHCHPKNLRSKGFAEKMGFHYEGILRWHCLLSEFFLRDGEPVWRKDDPPGAKNPGRHTVTLSVCWDDWESGVRENVQKQIDRKV